MQIRTQMDRQGKLQIPVILRKHLNYKPGDTFIVRVIDGELRILSLDKVITEIQTLFRKYNKENVSIVDGLLASRKEDYKFEQAKYKRLSEKKENSENIIDKIEREEDNND